MSIPHPKPKKRGEPTLREERDAVWAFLMEHCDIQHNGVLFVKFHTDDRANFERRVRARYKYDYHREDVKAKEAVHKKIRRSVTLKQEEMKKAMERLKRDNERIARYGKLYTFYLDMRRRIHSFMIKSKRIWQKPQ